ncbi:membrane protein insertase YidC [Candidatus Gribaldobacteria bacterium]|nr:membrane protein insertase YidC [Candidatus Gribaldobacteria bacterium]
MNFLFQIYYNFLFAPLLNGLVVLYYLCKDLGLAVVLLTLLVKIVLFPLSFKTLKSQKQIQKINPQILEIKAKNKGNLTGQNAELMELYKKEGISPASGCLPLLFQLPIIIALYRVFSSGLTSETLSKFLYAFVPNPGDIPLKVFWIFSPESSFFIIVLALLAALAQFWQARISLPAKSQKTKSQSFSFESAMQKQTKFLFPLITFFIVYKTGLVVGVYWFFSVLFSLAEHYFLEKKISKI